MSLKSKIIAAAFILSLFSVSQSFAAGAVSPDVSADMAGNVPPPMSADVRPASGEMMPPMPGSEDLSGPVINEITVSGNSSVVTEHILSAVTSKVGEHADEEKLRKDAEAIFELGFFSATDYKVTDVDSGGVNVEFKVQENPVVGSIEFSGNTVYTSDDLKKLLFTKPGMIFNRTFFRNDMQRIKEKYQADGYVMASVADVQVNGDAITVVIIEPRISQIIIQGNKITKKKIIERYMKIKEGDLFNSNKLRLTLNRLQGLGFFSDVNVNFEQGEKKEDVVIILTVEEGRTGKLGFSIAYGTSSGFGGGLSYENSNIGGRGLKLNVGFDLGDREEYWLSFEQPYMSGHVTAWKVGIYKRAWDDLSYYIDDEKQFEYDRDKYGAYFGFGRKFRDGSMYNWYMNFDWHKVSNDPSDNSTTKTDWGKMIVKNDPYETVLDDLGDGTYYSATLTLRRANIDEYLPYTKGDVESLNFQYGHAQIDEYKDVLGNTTGGDFNYMKYWLEAKYYVPIDKWLRRFFESSLGANNDKPIMFAARVIAGSSTGDVPYEELYTVGGDTTLRGYDDDRFRGEDMLLGNFEIRIPLQKAFGIVFFYDVGRAWRSGSTDGSFGSDLQDAPGFGVRLNTPLGNLRLDYADGEEGKFHFGFGEMF